jgi:mannose-1-phosphate guanylyltransferase
MTIPSPEKLKMRKDVDVIPHLWSIVLAGGEGTRLAPMIKQWLGEDRPNNTAPLPGQDPCCNTRWIGRTLSRIQRRG